MRSMPTVEMPKNYLAPAIVVLLLTVFPLSIVPLVYATQVAGKYDRGDYEGAETSSSRAKLWCMINAGVAAPIYLLVGGLVILGMHSFSGAVARAGQEREVIAKLNQAMRFEQAYYLENGNFVATMDLVPKGSSPSKLSAASRETKPVYQYKINVSDPKIVEVTAIPLRTDRHSFTAAAFVQGTSPENSTIVAITCRSEKPSMMAVKVPLLKGTTPTCAPGSKPPENRRSTANEDAAAGEVESPTTPAPIDGLDG
jgi:Tfp pilus assembly protein PilE